MTVLTTPSGAVYTDSDMLILQKMHEVGFVRYNNQPFTLKSGIPSHVYVYGREDLTDNPEMECMVGDKLCSMLFKAEKEAGKQVCLLGIPTAGTPFAQAAAMTSFFQRPSHIPICHRVMKEQPKDHGAHKGWINGKPKANHSYWLVDNVATNGASKMVARGKMRIDEYPDPYGVIIWIDRQQGAIGRLKEAGFNNVLVAYNLLDITYAFGEMDLWPKEAVKAVEREIEAHQFLPKI